MKHYFSFLFFLLISVANAQEVIAKKFELTLKEIEIDTKGLDEIILENAKDNFISILLEDENANKHDLVTEEEKGLLKISFIPMIEAYTDEVFRKFITKRVHRAVVKIKIPKDKNITFLGDEIDIVSKNYKGDISIFIDKGQLLLNKIKGNANVNLYSGNVLATISQSEIDIKSNKGKILVDKKLYQKEYAKQDLKAVRKFYLHTIKANVVINNQKTQ